ncbi:MAG TPA: fimbrillin family protein [Candidatus Egerieousia sp.]|nr:fimbrillin family protein [Candidatus Egerieousia sp.]HPT05217.1 fimbrillin family protein [Candidatus Egerieousia sp.]
MRNSILSLTALLLVLDLCGCKKGGNDIKDAKLGMIAWTQTMLDTSVDSLVSGDGFLDGDKIGVILSGNGYDTCSNVFVYEGGSWCGDAVPLAGENAYVYGFYPAFLPVTGEAVIPSCNDRTIPVKIVNPEYFCGKNQADYMWAVSTLDGKIAVVSRSKPAVSLLFMHALSKITFSIKLDDNVKGTAMLTGITLDKSAGAGSFYCNNGVMSFEASPAYRLSGLSSVSELNFSGGCPLYNNTYSNVDVLVAPVAADNITVTIAMEINGTLCTASQILPIETAASKVGNWEAGRNYIYKIVSNGDELSIQGHVSITGWDNSDGGSLEVN